MVLNKFIKEKLDVINENLQPDIVVLFGSRAYGLASDESDIDIIIVSKKFENIKFVKRAAYILKLLHYPLHVDPICYTPSEFERMKNISLVLKDALTNGIELKAA